MITTYKYELPVSDVFTLELPENARILSVQTQHNKPCIWCMVDTEAIKQKRVFEMFGTGHPISKISEPSIRDYIGTFQLQGGALVFHLFEICLPF